MKGAALLGLLLGILLSAEGAMKTKKLSTASYLVSGRINDIGDLLDEKQNTDAEVKK
jgi:hypothetical protein